MALSMTDDKVKTFNKALSNLSSDTDKILASLFRSHPSLMYTNEQCQRVICRQVHAESPGKHSRHFTFINVLPVKLPTMMVINDYGGSGKGGGGGGGRSYNTRGVFVSFLLCLLSASLTYESR